MKTLKFIISFIVVVTFIVMIGCKGEGATPREESLGELAEKEVAGEEVAEEVSAEEEPEEWWYAPSSGSMKVEELPEPDLDAGPFSIGIAVNDLVLPWTIDVWDGFEKSAEKYPNLDLHLFDCKNNPEGTLKVHGDIQNLNPDLVVYYNWVGGAGDKMAEWCVDNQKPEIEIDAPYGENAWYYGVNNIEIGTLGGIKMAEWVLENWAGEDIWIVNSTEYESGEDVYHRISEFVKNFTEMVGDSVNIMNVDENGKADELNNIEGVEVGMQNMSEWLTAHPDAHHVVVFSSFDAAGIGMYRGAKNQGRLDDCIFGSIEGAPNLRELLFEDEDRRYLGTVAMFPEKYGEGCLKMAWNILTGYTPPKRVVIFYDWVTIDSLEKYYPDLFE